MHRIVTNLTFTRSRPGWVRLSVIDHGRGIDPDDLDTIFNEFARGRLAENDGGSGLGLASVRELVEQQDGVAAIESKVGVGTTVTIDLPSPRAIKPAAPSQRSTLSSSVRLPVEPTGQASG